ncbi:hypothetical protein D0809_20990 [Flavobacterium circumlabens]|uniref:Lipocalin-like domain-containing protein n=1 Tax=Flavobacterium circumlabens TaxID=2133765 RepID=A0A4Y7U7F9_9FLAO|nr:hypothetical protein [Flavobacterium circumlabens]TCN53073.1 hypothetical protein EV142_10956 [Flavobacterium circumlabens]TEB42373.1 hypothetical protein D0809_20990 [Flavobacterium circumlabens]
MKIRSQIVLLFFTAIIVSSCSPAITEKEVTGCWKAADGAFILLNKNGTFSASRISYFYFSDDDAFKSRKIDLSGKWVMGTIGNPATQTVELKSNQTYKDFGIAKTYTNRNGVERPYKINCTLEIMGSGPFTTSTSYNLVRVIDDPDDMNFYTFKKQ